MATKYAKHISTRNQTPMTSQTQKASPKQRKNAAGGYTFKVDDWTRLERFLILGNEGGTYYTSERKLTKENAQCIHRCHKADAKRTIDTIVDISVNNRAPKQDPAIFALAMLSIDPLALLAMPQVCRTSTHLFQFLAQAKEFRGWGRALRNAVAAWYTTKNRNDLVYQVTKYRQRDGWTHRDALRLAHPQDDNLNDIFKWIVGKLDLTNVASHDKAINQLGVFEELQHTTDPRRAARLVREFNMVREHVPTELLNSKEVWEALLEKMPLTAMIRNLGKMSSIGLVAPMSDGTKKVVEQLENTEALRKARIHPFALLLAQDTYGQGHGVKGSLAWKPVAQVTDALDDAFHAAFGILEPTGKNWLLGIDVSSSMCGGAIAGTHITPNKGCAALAMVTARTEKNYHIMGFADSFRELGITAKDSLQSAMRKTSRMSFGGTDCSLPMEYALQHGIPVDVFAIYTDNETWAGHRHPHQALENYRQKMGRDAKMITVGMTATSSSIANPDDAGMLDIVGFDASAPNVMREFAVE